MRISIGKQGPKPPRLPDEGPLDYWIRTGYSPFDQIDICSREEIHLSEKP